MKQNFFHDKKKVAQKGFYLVLFLCVVTVAVTGYIVTKDSMDLYTSQLNEYMDQPENILEPTLTPDPSTEAIPAEVNVTTEEPPIKEVPVTPTKSAGAKSNVQQTPKAENAVTTPIKSGPLYLWPITGEVSSPYSLNELIYSKTLDDWRAHMGIDIKANVGTAVKAMADGEVSDIYFDEMYGNVAVLSHSDKLISIYINLSPEIPVKVGQKVKAGDTIGGVGESAIFELAEVPHLHFEVLEDGKQIDPLKYLK